MGPGRRNGSGTREKAWDKLTLTVINHLRYTTKHDLVVVFWLLGVDRDTAYARRVTCLHVRIAPLVLDDVHMHA